MEPLAERSSRSRGLTERVAIAIMVAAILVAVGVVTLVSLYMTRMGEAVASLSRVDPVPSYLGRPSAVMIDGTAPVNFLVMTTSAVDGGLSAVMIGHLSANRRHFTLVGLPDDLQVTTPGGRTATLAETYRIDPALTARTVEGLTRTRMDHQIHLELSGFVRVVDALEGLEMSPEARGGAGVSDSHQTRAYLDSAPDSIHRVERTMDVVRATLARLSRANVITNPGRFDAVMDAIIPCLVVDSDLTSTEIEATAMELRVRGDEIAGLRLATTPGSADSGEPVQVADAHHLDQISEALASDRIADLARDQGPSWSPSVEPSR